MAKGANFRVQMRRRREGKTDYKARKALIMSGKPRLVARSSTKNMIAQVVVAKQVGDEILAAAHSSELKEYGWNAPGGNVPSAYLTGLLCGLRAKKVGTNEAVLDLGLAGPTKGSRLFAVLNGALDAGMNIPHSEEKLGKERAKAEHIAKYAKSLSADSEEYSKRFSRYLSKGLAPEKLPEHFQKIKAAIISSFKTEGKEA
jgi:large subunit ribosomal protein L18